MMKILKLNPITEDQHDLDLLQSEITRLFREEIYAPIALEMGASKNIFNSLDDLLLAIQTGRLSYYRGRFTGKFSSTLSRALRSIGAEWDRKTGSFSIPQSSLPNDVRTAISLSETAFKAKVDRVFSRLSGINESKFEATSLLDNILWKTEKKFEKSIKNISIAPKITPEDRLRISKEYTDNLQLYISDFTTKETAELRKNIEKTVLSGGRYESVIGDIKKSYGVSQRKAKFLARQETMLMLTKYSQVRYQSAGIDEYEWHCRNHPHDHSPDQHTPGNVRYYHGLNHKKIFRWSEGAIVNEKGERKNPGQDYNCFCIAIPVVRFY